ncbi:MAG: F0F1 ATP synthase subunit delta [Candidatus Daviesbacteria bacterium]|nr:F0F1 ATP synthase subunit delta [Candidatus Daviesbacteria bacterium]
MKIPKKLKKDVELAVKASFKNGKILREKVLKFTKLFKSLPTVLAISSLTLYQKGLKREVSKRTLVIESAISLSPKDMGKIKNQMSKDYPIMDTKNILNKDLIGGLRIKIGDILIDDSITGRIKMVGEVIHG